MGGDTHSRQQTAQCQFCTCQLMKATTTKASSRHSLCACLHAPTMRKCCCTAAAVCVLLL